MRVRGAGFWLTCTGPPPPPWAVSSRYKTDHPYPKGQAGSLGMNQQPGGSNADDDDDYYRSNG